MIITIGFAPTWSNRMASRYTLFCLTGFLALPASLALACHLEMASVELNCTHYKFQVTGVGVPPTYSIRYTFNLQSTTGQAPIAISNTIPVTKDGNFIESVTNPISLAGNYGAEPLSGVVSLITATGQTESTIPMTFSPAPLNCSSPSS